jgi:hypothetical protein
VTGVRDLILDVNQNLQRPDEDELVPKSKVELLRGHLQFAFRSPFDDIIIIVRRIPALSPPTLRYS